MSISIEQAKTFIYEDIKEKYDNVVEFEITSAEYSDGWDIQGKFSYEITNKSLLVEFSYGVNNNKSLWKISSRSKNKYWIYPSKNKFRF